MLVAPAGVAAASVVLLRRKLVCTTKRAAGDAVRQPEPRHAVMTLPKSATTLPSARS